MSSRLEDNKLDKVDFMEGFSSAFIFMNGERVFDVVGEVLHRCNPANKSD